MTCDDEWDGPVPSLGSVSVLTQPPKEPPPRREFPIGFHVAAPGPSHDDEPPAKPRRRKRSPQP